MNWKPTTAKFVRSTVTLAGVALAVLSLLTLISGAFKAEFVTTVESILDYYKGTLGWALGWLEPPIQTVLVMLKDQFNWPLELNSSWRHVAVLTLLYYSRDVRSFREAGDMRGFLIIGPWALLVWLLSSVAAGIAIHSKNEFWPNYWIATAPMSGFVIYFFGRSAWSSIYYTEEKSRLLDFVRRNYFNGKDVLVGFLIVAGGLMLPTIQQLSSPGLAMLLCVILLFSMRHVWRGWLRSVGTPEIHKFNAFLRHGNTMLGASMLTAFIVSGIIAAVSLK